MALDDFGGMDVHVKCGDSRSSPSRDIRRPYFVTDEGRTTMTTPAYAGHYIRRNDAKEELL